jgi:poly(3-hydroxyalkanoate) depolymerase
MNAKAPASGTTVLVDGHPIRVEVRRGTARHHRPLLMCCGIGAAYDALTPLVDALDPRITVVRFDVPGVGGSPAPLLPYTFPGLARLTRRLMGALGHEEFDVLGFSWGGALAQQLAWQNPRRVRRLVLVSTGTGVLMVPGSPGVLWRMLTPHRYRDARYATALAPTLYGGSARRHTPEIRAMFEGLQARRNGRGYAYQLLAGAMWTSLPLLATIRQPTLVMSGDDDPIVPLANARILSSFIPRARLRIFRGGHVEPIVEAGSIAPHITAFLLESP